MPQYDFRTPRLYVEGPLQPGVQIALSAAQANLNAIFEYAQDALQAQSISELMELSATHSRRQLETMAQQSREIANAAQKLATESARPLAGGFGSQFTPMS